MTESEKYELIKRKAMLFRFLNFQMQTREQFWGDDADFQAVIDDILDQVIKINNVLRQYADD